MEDSFTFSLLHKDARCQYYWVNHTIRKDMKFKHHRSTYVYLYIECICLYMYNI